MSSFGSFSYIFLHLMKIYTFVLTLLSWHIYKHYNLQKQEHKKACHDETRKGKWCEIINSNKYTQTLCTRAFLSWKITLHCFEHLKECLSFRHLCIFFGNMVTNSPQNQVRITWFLPTNISRVLSIGTSLSHNNNTCINHNNGFS